MGGMGRLAANRPSWVMPKIQLNPLFEGAVGQFNGYVVGKGRTGLVLRRKPTYRRTLSPAQREGAERMRLVSSAWNELTFEQAEAWRLYAKEVVRHRSLDGRPYRMTGQTAFVGLGTKVLQVDPGAPIPLWPPTEEFVPDTIPVTADPTPGAIRFTAEAANTPGTLTELMVQKLASRLRQPGNAYVAAAFVAFTEGALSADVPLPPAPYACAFRFVEKSTGRTTLYVPIGTVEVG